MPSDDSDERADGGVDAVDFDTIEDEELPEWATEEPSVPADEATDPDDIPRTFENDGPGATDTSSAGADEAVDAATAVNFANVETGASASVSIGAGEAGNDGSVGWSRTEADYGDTGGTSIDPDIDDVDPGDLLDDIDDGSFPRPGVGDGSVVANPPLVPTDPTAAFGLGVALVVAIGGCYLLLATAIGVWTAMAVVLASVLAVGLFATAVDLFDRRSPPGAL